VRGKSVIRSRAGGRRFMVCGRPLELNCLPCKKEQKAIRGWEKKELKGKGRESPEWLTMPGVFVNEELSRNQTYEPAWRGWQSDRPLHRKAWVEIQ